MFIVRPAASSDIPALEALIRDGAPGVHTLPRTRATIEEAVQRSMAAFSAQPDRPGAESYMFVLESLEDRQLAGTATMSATAGASGTFFSFRREVINQVSRDLGISHNVHALTLCTDLTNCSQLSGFFMHEQWRTKPEAALLSRARLLYAAWAPHRFSEQFFASMPGITDADGRSPFWEALGRKFFRMDFLEAERMIEGARNRTLIAELMPHYPVYVPLLPAEAQAALGQVHPAGAMAARILRAEGFMQDNYVDLFDGAAILQAHRNALHAFTRSRRRSATAKSIETGRASPCLVSVAGDGRFRALLADCALPGGADTVALPAEAMRALDVVQGDPLLCVKL